MRDHIQFDRRRFLQAAGLLAAGAATAACGGGGGDSGSSPPATPPASAAPPGTFTEPRSALSGALSILMWSHFVPAHDTWFDPWVKEWGSRVGVDVTVDHINYAELPARTQAEIQARQGHDLILHIAPVSPVRAERARPHRRRHRGEQPARRAAGALPPLQLQPDHAEVLRLLTRHGCPTRATTAAASGRPPGSATARDVGRPAAWRGRDQGAQGVQLGVGMSQEIDSNMAGRALLWSFGASIQDADEQVVINSPQTVEAVDFMARLYRDAMTPEVFSWNAASNNQGLAAGPAVLHPQLDLGVADLAGDRPRGRRRHLLHPGAARPGGRPGGQPRHVQLDRPGLRGEPGRGQGVPAALHGQPERGGLELAALRLPRVRVRRARARRMAAERPLRRPPGRQARAARRRDRVEHEHRPPGDGQHRRRRGVRDVRHPEHVRPRRPRRGHPAAGGRGRRGADPADLRPVAVARG